MSIAEKLQTIAENEQKVYEAGQKSEYDRFWDSYQQNGERTIYRNAFSGACWNADILKPKYPINLNNTLYKQVATGMFSYCNWATPTRLDLSYLTIDFSSCVVLDDLFCNARVENIYIDASSAEQINKAFMCNDGGNIDNITLKVTEKCKQYSNTFSYSSSITNLTFVEGSVIAANISLQWSKSLTLESLKSVLIALKNYAGTEEEYSKTIQLSGESWAILEADGATSPNGNTWKDYVNQKKWNY